MGLIEKLQASELRIFLQKPVLPLPMEPFPLKWSLLQHHPKLSIAQTSNTVPNSLGLELYRLEQRYTRREKRTTFISDARYVDGEYVYGQAAVASPTSAKSSSSWNIGVRQNGDKGASVRIREFVGNGRTGKDPI